MAVAFGCGSDDGKKTNRDERGAAGASGAPSDGGSAPNAGAPSAGASEIPSAGQAGEATGGGASGGAPIGGAPTSDAGAGGVPIENGGAGGEPAVPACETKGSVSLLDVTSDAIYAGCRGSSVHLPYLAVDATSTFACCGTSSSQPSFQVPLSAAFYAEFAGGDLQLEVPTDAPLGQYALDLACPTTLGEHSVSIVINDALPPVVHSISGEIWSSGPMVIEGLNLLKTQSINAVRVADGQTYACIIQQGQFTDTSITCSFNGEIPMSADPNDSYRLEVSSEECGFAADPALFWVGPTPT